MPLYNRHGSPREPFSAINSKGKTVMRNFGIERVEESLLRCDGCGREFNAFKLVRSSGFALSHDSQWLHATNRARAINHAARCKGTTRPAEVA